jgi:hypothetical protein
MPFAFSTAAAAGAVNTLDQGLGGIRLFAGGRNASGENQIGLQVSRERTGYLGAGHGQDFTDRAEADFDLAGRHR